MAQPDWVDLDGLAVANTRAAEALTEVVSDFGHVVTGSPERLRAALADILGAESREHRAEIDALALAAEEGIPDDAADGDPELLTARLVARGLTVPVSHWAVHAWRAAIAESPLVQATVRRSDLVDATVMRSDLSADSPVEEPPAVVPSLKEPPLDVTRSRGLVSRELAIPALIVVLLLLLGWVIIASAAHGSGWS
ncbi:MAG: hypothetical protein V9G19_20210 [Tetrasphaera sp.]